MADFQRSNPRAAEATISLHKGQITRLVPYLLQQESAAFVENLIINSVGSRTTRGGARAFGGHTTSPGGIGSYNDASFTEFMVGLWGDELYQSTGNGGWDQIATGASFVGGQLHDFARVFTGGNLALAICTCQQATEPSSLVVYDIANDASSSVSLGARCMASFQNRLWVGTGQDLYWSDINAPLNFSLTGNFLTLEPGLGGDITAIVPARDNAPFMWIFKERAVLLFSPAWGSSSALLPTAGDGLDVISSSLRILSADTGCIATRSATWVPGNQSADLFFLSEDGIRTLLRGDNDAQQGAGFPISFSIPDLVDRITWAHAHKAAAAFHDHAYHLAVPLDGNTNNTNILRYDIGPDNQSWSSHNWQSRDIRNFRLGAQSRFFFQNGFGAGDTSVTEVSSDSLFQVYQGFRGRLDPSEAKIIGREDSRAYIFGLAEFNRKKSWENLSLHVSSSDTTIYDVFYRQEFGAWNFLAQDALPGSGGAVVLGVDPLPWAFSEDTVRRRTFLLRDLPPSRFIQIRIAGATGQTDIGALTVYHEEVVAAPKQQQFGDEN